jgi:hypothetical protein
VSGDGATGVICFSAFEEFLNLDDFRVICWHFELLWARCRVTELSGVTGDCCFRF